MRYVAALVLCLPLCAQEPKPKTIKASAEVIRLPGGIVVDPNDPKQMEAYYKRLQQQADAMQAEANKWADRNQRLAALPRPNEKEARERVDKLISILEVSWPVTNQHFKILDDYCKNLTPLQPLQDYYKVNAKALSGNLGFEKVFDVIMTTDVRAGLFIAETMTLLSMVPTYQKQSSLPKDDRKEFLEACAALMVSIGLTAADEKRVFNGDF